MCELNAMAQNSGEALLVRTVSSNSNNSKLIELNYDGNILIQDVVQNRTKNANSVLRKDEAGRAADYKLFALNSPVVANAPTLFSFQSGQANGTNYDLTELDTTSYPTVSTTSFPGATPSQSNGVITVPAGKYLITFSATVNDIGTAGIREVTLRFRKNGSTVQEVIGTGQGTLTIHYVELLDANGSTTYQLQANIDGTRGTSFFDTTVLALVHKSFHIHNLGES